MELKYVHGPLVLLTRLKESILKHCLSPDTVEEERLPATIQLTAFHCLEQSAGCVSACHNFQSDDFFVQLCIS